MRPNYSISDHGLIVLIHPLTAKFARWLRDTAPEDAQFWGPSMAVEPRYLQGVIQAAEEEGF